MLKPILKEGSKPVNPYKEISSLQAFHYLDSDEAYPLFAKAADIIEERGYKGIVDVGCRLGRVNDILKERSYEYDYMGFDTSPEPISLAQEKWADASNIEYRLASWNDKAALEVDFNVDVVLFYGVLCYLPNTHKKLFHELVVDLYGAEGAIVEDLRLDQPNVIDRIKVNYIYDELLQYKNLYRSVIEYKIDCKFFYGNRTVMDIRIYEP